jgi:hypothetical protein
VADRSYCKGTTDTGGACRQTVGASGFCVWHAPGTTAEDRHAVAVKGGIASRMKRALPAGYQVPALDSHEAIAAWARDMAGRVLRAEVDPKLVSEARSCVQLVVQSAAARDQRQLVEALLAIERGGAAMVLLTRLQDGLADGRRKPIPGRALAPVPSGADS